MKSDPVKLARKFREEARLCSDADTARLLTQIADQLDQLVTLPGVGRKTASVVLAEAFGRPAIAVDTHVSRVSRRLGSRPRSSGTTTSSTTSSTAGTR